MGKRIKLIVNQSAELFEKEVNDFLDSLDSRENVYLYDVSFAVRSWSIDGQSGSEFTACVTYAAEFGESVWPTWD